MAASTPSLSSYPNATTTTTATTTTSTDLISVALSQPLPSSVVPLSDIGMARWYWTNHGLAAQLVAYGLCMSALYMFTASPSVSELKLGLWFGWQHICALLMLVIVLVPEHQRHTPAYYYQVMQFDFSADAIWIHSRLSFFFSLAFFVTDTVFVVLRIVQFVSHCQDVTTQCGRESTVYGIITFFVLLCAVFALFMIVVLYLSPDPRHVPSNFISVPSDSTITIRPAYLSPPPPSSSSSKSHRSTSASATAILYAPLSRGNAQHDHLSNGAVSTTL